MLMWVLFFALVCVVVLSVLYVLELKKDGVQSEYDPIDVVSVQVFDASQSVDETLKLGAAVSSDLSGIPYYEWSSKVHYNVPDMFYYKPMYLVPTVNQGATSMCVPYAVLQMIVARRFVSKQVFPSCSDPLVMLSTNQYLEVSGESKDVARTIPGVLDYMRSDKYSGGFKLESDESKVLSVKLGGTYQYRSVGDIQRDIFENGPVVTVMNLPKQMQTYEYKVTNGEVPPEVFLPSEKSDIVGGHAVLVIGWLYERSRLPVSRLLWICKNSWGTNWPKNPWRGMSGVFFVDASTFDVTKNCLGCSVE
jgi:hypothetical protein